MTLPKGRIIKGGTPSASPIPRDQAGAERGGHLLKKAAAEAALEATARIAAADERARAILAAAEDRARAIAEQAREDGEREGAAALTAAWVKLRTEESARDERDLDRTIELARAMAERLVGEALGLDDAKVVSIAKQVLASARQSRRVVLRAHPDDADALHRNLGALGLEQAAIEIHADPARARGSLLLDTDLGTLDANVTLQLDRLARSLRDSLRS
jgi:flagellar biosynthesis/type III secretory pathway protein FliH